MKDMQSWIVGIVCEPFTLECVAVSDWCAVLKPAGHFGCVFHGTLLEPDGQRQHCAVKSLNREYKCSLILQMCATCSSLFDATPWHTANGCLEMLENTCIFDKCIILGQLCVFYHAPPPSATAAFLSPLRWRSMTTDTRICWLLTWGHQQHQTSHLITAMSPFCLMVMNDHLMVRTALGCILIV